MTVFGPDVSKWQQGLVPPTPPGIAFGMCRATKGIEVDPVVDNVIAWCRTNKVPFAAYHFCVPTSRQSSTAQAAAFAKAVGDRTIPCMLDWERSVEGWEPTFDDALDVIEDIRALGHKVALLYAPDWYWESHGKPTLSGHGFDLVSSDYQPSIQGDAETVYRQRGGDAGPGWQSYGGLTPVIWQFNPNVTWGNQQLDMNAYRGDPTRLNTWFKTWTGGSVAEVLYPYGYGGAKLPMDEIEAKITVKNAHREFWRRFKALMIAGQGKIGPGTMWRSSDVQRNTFLSRHYVVKEGGCCYFEGNRYQLKQGQAHAAPPGRSFHESTFHGYAQACDVVGDLAWMHANEAPYGIKDFRTVGNEPWHVQLTEIANSVTKWIAAGRPQPQIWKLPGGPIPPTPTPSSWITRVIGSMPNMKQGATGINVVRMQHFLVMAGTLKGPSLIDADFGPVTTEALNDWRESVKMVRNGVCDTACWNGFMAASDSNGIPTLAKGAIGSDVARMQRMLSANGFMDKDNAANFDGRFGSGTEGALKRFQDAKDAGADGQCGPKTWESLLTGKNW